MTPKPEIGTRRRTAIACEGCRIRRIKCDGMRPCKACLAAGGQASCIGRTQARPRRARPSAISDKHVHSIKNIEKRLDAWLSTQGLESLALPEVTRLERWSSRVLIDEDVAIEQSRAFFPLFLTPLPAETLQEQYHRYRTSSSSLATDERAFVLSCICLGTCVNAKPEIVSAAAQYWKEARRELAKLDQATMHSLRALLHLQLFAQRIGGPEDAREILKDFSCRIRQLYSTPSQSPGAAETKAEMQRLLRMGLYRDSWFAALCDAPPCMDMSDFMTVTLTPTDDISNEPISLDGIPPNLLQMASVENRILHQIHGGRINTLSIEYVLNCEKDLLLALSIKDNRDASTLMYKIDQSFALTRYHWMRLVLHAPLMNDPLQGPSSTSIAVRSISTILHTYSYLASQSAFFPCWPQLRRVTSCGQLLLLVFVFHKELSRVEAENLAILVLNLLQEHDMAFTFVPDLRRRFESAFLLNGLDVQNPIQSTFKTSVVDNDKECMFDFSLPSTSFVTEESLWIWPPLF